jgi:hypothetical protein
MRNFKCECCEKVFSILDDWTEEKEKAEYKKNFSDKYKDDELVITCDSCYEEILADNGV